MTAKKSMFANNKMLIKVYYIVSKVRLTGNGSYESPTMALTESNQVSEY